MNSQHTAPKSSRAKFVFFLWNNLPRFLLLAMIVLVFILAGAIKKESASIAAIKADGLKQEKPPINAVTLTLKPQPIHDRINLPGNIEPWTTLSLLAKISGTLEEILVREGQKVKKGDILARLDDEDYRIAVDRAKSAFELAKAEYERDKAIYAKGVIPTAELDSNKTRMETARADYENAQLQLSRCIITSPMQGVVRRLDAKVGLQLAVGDPLAEIIEIDRVKAVVGIPESDVTAVRGVDSVDISLQALGNRIVSGKVHYLASSPDTVARLFRLELAIDNQAGEILPGMFFRADVVKRIVPDAVVIPYYSVISRINEQYVYVEDQGIVHKKTVRLGVMEKWAVEVIEGLSSGERLVVEGHRDVEDQQKVKVVKAAVDIKELML
jgi:membrane fusion protein (multidrug efflux system)